MPNGSAQPIITRWCVITGAPSSGKTTIIDQLRNRGFNVVEEAARAYIESELALGRSLQEIRSDEAAFQQAILTAKQRTEARLPPNELIFLDRGSPDTISYYRLAGLDTAAVADQCLFYKYAKVFICDPLPFEKDGIRTESEATAQRLDLQLEQDYRISGYDPIRVPVISVDDRVNFILQQVLGSAGKA